jgi:hypothetical protein
MNAQPTLEDALGFLCTLYAGQPDGTLIAVGDLRRPTFVHTPEDAVSCVVGHVDAFHRVTLLGHQPSGRGDEDDAVWLPGVWADIDVNGTPDGKDGVKTGAAPTREVALELAHAVLEPTITVDSGGGVHAYWLLDEPLTLRDGTERADAKALSVAWQARMRHEARALGIEHLDGTADIARVLRPVGSLNGKGQPAVPVTLLDDGGPRYTLEKLRDAGIPTSPNGATVLRLESHGDDEQVALALLERHDRLRRFVKRTGKKPGDASPSAWDYALACRAAEYGASDGQITALIRHARRQHNDAKAERVDYVERTVVQVRQRIGRPTETSVPDELLAKLTDLTAVGQVGLSVSDIVIGGHGEGADAALILSDGSTVEFTRIDHVAMPQRLAHRLAADAGVAIELSAIQASTIAALMRRYVGRASETHRHQLAVDWGLEVLGLAYVNSFDFADGDERWRTWSTLNAFEPDASKPMSPSAYAREMIVAHDRGTGRRYLRAGWMQEYVRRTGSREAQSDVVQLMCRVGWERPRDRRARVTAAEPGGPGRLRLPMFIAPAGWEDAQ